MPEQIITFNKYQASVIIKNVFIVQSDGRSDGMLCGSATNVSGSFGLTSSELNGLKRFLLLY